MIQFDGIGVPHPKNSFERKVQAASSLLTISHTPRQVSSKLILNANEKKNISMTNSSIKYEFLSHNLGLYYIQQNWVCKRNETNTKPQE